MANIAYPNLLNCEAGSVCYTDTAGEIASPNSTIFDLFIISVAPGFRLPGYPSNFKSRSHSGS